MRVGCQFRRSLFKVVEAMLVKVIFLTKRCCRHLDLELEIFSTFITAVGEKIVANGRLLEQLRHCIIASFSQVFLYARNQNETINSSLISKLKWYSSHNIIYHLQLQFGI